MQDQKATQITEGVIWKQLLLFFFPILLGTFFQQLYNTVDTIIVGRFVGTQALAAVGERRGVSSHLQRREGVVALSDRRLYGIALVPLGAVTSS